MYITNNELLKLTKNCIEQIPKEIQPESYKLYFGIVFGFLKTQQAILEKEEDND